jgi:phenylpropionate dioxygenase-like ring-hydroxylating dioxygenase large terminal subunit
VDAVLPWSAYTDPELFRREQRELFRRTWQYVGHHGRLPEPASWFPADVGDLPVVVVRDEHDQLRAFANVCRHRGSTIVEEEGRGRTLRCPYHAWTYRLDGTLHRAPRSEHEPGFSPDGIALAPLAVDRWGPLVFVNADPEAQSLADALGPLPELVRSAGIDVDALEHRRHSRYALAANWKIAAENFLECYHCAVAHPSLSRLLDVSRDAYTLDADGTLFTQIGPRRGGDGAPYDADGEIERGQFHFLFPNLKLNIEPGPQNLSIGPLLPAGPERTEGFFDYFFGPGVTDEWIDEFVAFDDEVGAEDTRLVEAVQRGVRSGAVERGRLLPESESLVARFQALVAKDLRLERRGMG